MKFKVGYHVRWNSEAYEANLPLVWEALEQGTKRGRAIAQETMALVRGALDLSYLNGVSG